MDTPNALFSALPSLKALFIEYLLTLIAETNPAPRLTCCPTRATLVVLQRRRQIKIRTAAKVLTGQGTLLPGVQEGD